MASANLIEILINARDDATRKLDAVGRATVKSAEQMKRMGMAMMGAGAAGVAALTGMTYQSLQFANQIKTTAGQTGLAAETIQRLAWAAENNETPLEAVTQGLTKITVAAVEAARGGKAQREAFDGLGIAYTDSSGKARDSISILMDLADRFAAGTLSSEDMADGLELIGLRGGLALIPMLKLGSAGIQEFMDKATVLSGAKIESLDEMGDRIGDLRTRFKVLSGDIVTLAKPAIDSIISAVERLASWFENLSPGQRQAITNLLVFGSVALLAVGALVAIGGAVRALSILGSPLMLQILGWVIAFDLVYRVIAGLLWGVSKLVEAFGRLFRLKGAEQLGAGMAEKYGAMTAQGGISAVGAELGLGGLDLGGLAKTFLAPMQTKSETGSKTSVEINAEFSRSDEAMEMLRAATEASI